MIAEITQVREHLAAGELKAALKLLAQVLTISSSDLHNEVLLLTARFSKLQSQSRKGILSREQQDLEFNRIANGVLEISEEATADVHNVQGFIDLKAHLEAAAQKFNLEWAGHLPQAVLRRIVYAREMGLAFRILWIDDHLGSIQHEKAVLETMDIDIDLVRSSAAADQLLTNGPAYDLVLSDVGRGGDPGAGLSFAQDVYNRKLPLPFIFYTMPPAGELALPANTFGVAYLPHELFHLVLDVLARKE